ncbi:SCO family protein [Pararhizobium mangrovi]|uniref:SCO family protein n=1 Tax=Pararhizobium mangrovi TaxID=2590452 RepID=A0A506U7T8_9HYPH|nr:SCO family protein [Pararhizobium mangrovi]TPW29548.1 SCO family protein [Pararhizobium mangrovi]
MTIASSGNIIDRTLAKLGRWSGVHRHAIWCLALVSVLYGCTDEPKFHATDLSGSALPRLAFTMTRADDGKAVTAADYAGKITLLYFGYTYCPDVCPLTMANTARVLDKLGKKAKDVRVLFVTVDPNRDTRKVLKQYASAFAPEFDGLRGTDNELGAIAKRYRVAHSVHPSPDPSKYTVQHSSAVYVFDRKGEPRLLFTSLDTPDPKIEADAEDLSRLMDENRNDGFLAWAARLF